jgi:quinol monooxygenase YgiN
MDARFCPDEGATMSAPIVFISHFRVKEGGLEGLERLSKDVTRSLEAEKPATLLFLQYVDADAIRVTFVHAFADAESTDRHFEGAAERAANTYEFIRPDGWEIYGKPSDAALEQMQRSATSAGVTLTVQPEYLDGFLRLAPAS